MHPEKWRHIVYTMMAMVFVLVAPVVSAEDTVGDEVADGINLIVTAEDRDNARLGSFEEVEGYLSTSRRILRSSGVDAGRFSFGAPIAKAGWYRVYLWWPVRPAGSAQVSVRVLHARGVSQLSVDQSTLGGQWRLLGIFPFQAGTAAPRVELAARSGQSLLADALRLQFAGVKEPQLKIRTDALAIAEVGDAFEAELHAEGGDGVYTWAALGALPSGLTLRGDGHLVGTPIEAGAFNVNIEVRDGGGKSATRRLRLDVVPAQKRNSGALPGSQRHADALSVPAHAGVMRPRPPAPIKVAAAGTLALGATAASLVPAPDLSGVLGLLRAAAAGSWVKGNQNKYSDVWPPAELRPLYGSGVPTPEKILLAWSSFAWDTNRARIWLYGGGHANYFGNDVYTWNAANMLWERAAYSSEIVQDALGTWIAIDGVDAAPASAHTYDNNIFLPIIDRFLTFGGGVQDGSGNYRRMATPTTTRRTGPYLFDPNRADGNKVGGTTGSHVKRVAPHAEVVGGNMWQNRDLPLNLSNASDLPASHISGCTAYAEEGGKDVVYLGGRVGSGTALQLYRYVINDVANPSSDSLAKVGTFAVGTSAQTACAYDPVGKLVVRLGNSATLPFTYWNLNNAGATNKDQVVPLHDPDNVFLPLVQAGTLQPQFCGFDFDGVRRKYLLWCGDDRVWSLTAPSGSAGWVIRKETSAAGSAGAPSLGPGTGVLGKWKYAANLDAYIGVQDIVQGNVWIYKPVGWVDPGSGNGGGNIRPQVAITSPVANMQFTAGDSIVITANASDADGSITGVQFFSGATPIGEVASAPYAIDWINVPAGSYSLTAVATDDAGGSTTSSPVAISVQAAGSGSVQMQEGSNGYAGTRDTYLVKSAPTGNFGKAVTLNTTTATDNAALVRFAIFQSEGGPVPNGATITAATLSLYKYTTYDYVYRVHRILVAWDETQATWNNRMTGIPWSAAGCSGSDTDYLATADDQRAVTWDPQWIDFDVTAGVQAMRAGTPNYGWRLLPVSGNANLKRFHSRESTSASLRPKLSITYTAP